MELLPLLLLLLRCRVFNILMNIDSAVPSLLLGSRSWSDLFLGLRDSWDRVGAQDSHHMIHFPDIGISKTTSSYLIEVCTCSRTSTINPPLRTAFFPVSIAEVELRLDQDHQLYTSSFSFLTIYPPSLPSNQCWNFIGFLVSFLLFIFTQKFLALLFPLMCINVSRTPLRRFD